MTITKHLLRASRFALYFPIPLRKNAGEAGSVILIPHVETQTRKDSISLAQSRSVHPRELGSTAQPVCLQSFIFFQPDHLEVDKWHLDIQHITYLLCHNATEPGLSVQTF